MKNPLTNGIGLFLWVMGAAIVLAFSACEKDKSEPLPTNLRDLPGVGYLGQGYNAFGDFAATDELKAALIDFEQYRKEQVGDKEYRVPEEVNVQLVESNAFLSFLGQTPAEFQGSQMAAVGLSGGYPYFSGAVLSNFQVVHYRTLDYAFVQVGNTVNRWTVSLPHDAALLRTMLTDAARADLANLPPDELFAKYGTHLLTAATIGARADYYVAADKGKTAQIVLAQAAEASFKAALGLIDLDAEPQYQEMVNTLRENAFIGVRVQGGNPACGHNILAPGNYQAWLNSVDDGLVISNLANPSLLPLWELCENSTRRAAVEQAFQAYASAHELPPVVTDAKTSITEILIKSGTEENPYFYQEPGFKVIPENLNEGTGGDYIFLMYKEGLDIEASISELTTVSGANPQAPAGWFRIGTDLNEGTGSGGDPKIYLCYKKAAFSDNPVRQLMVLKGEEPLLPEGFVFVNNFYYHNHQDFNHGAGGTPVYLIYSREVSKP